MITTNTSRLLLKGSYSKSPCAFACSIVCSSVSPFITLVTNMERFIEPPSALSFTSIRSADGLSSVLPSNKSYCDVNIG